jgi:malate/lactate dehydrogenase
LLGQHFDVDPHHVHAYGVGEHGNSEVLAWSQTTVAGLSLDGFPRVHGSPRKTGNGSTRTFDVPPITSLPRKVRPCEEALRRGAAILRDATASFGV